MLEKLDPDPDEVEVLNDSDDYRRQELWTDGEWIRLGRDVLGDRYIEVRYENMSDLINTLRGKSSVDYVRVDNTQGDAKYIVECGYSLDVYQNRKHVLYHSEHEYGVLSTALKRAREKRVTFDYETLIESHVKTVKSSFWEIDKLDVPSSAKTGNVVLADPRGTSVDFHFIEKLREDDVIDFGEYGYVYFEDDHVKYKFTVDGGELRDDEEE